MLDHVQNWDERLVDYFIHTDNRSSETDKIKGSDACNDAAVDFMQFLKQGPHRKEPGQLKPGEICQSQPQIPMQSTDSVRSTQKISTLEKFSENGSCPVLPLETEDIGQGGQTISEHTFEEGEVLDEDEDLNDNETTDDNGDGDRVVFVATFKNPAHLCSVRSKNASFTDSRCKRTGLVEPANTEARSRRKRNLPSGTLADLFTPRETQ